MREVDIFRVRNPDCIRLWSDRGAAFTALGSPDRPPDEIGPNSRTWIVTSSNPWLTMRN